MVERISQDVTDISSSEQLLRYATAGQLELLARRARLSQQDIALGADLGATARTAGPVLARALRDGLTVAQLRGLDRLISALSPDLEATGCLTQLALRLASRPRGINKAPSLIANIPSSWARQILEDIPMGDSGILVQASALLSELTGAANSHVAEVSALRERYRVELELLIRQLILISVSPSMSKKYDARMLLGMLAIYAFDLIRDRLESEFHRSPLTFRMWPAITQLVMLSKRDENTQALQVWVRQLIGQSADFRKYSLDADSTFDLETAISVPAAWSPPTNDWVGSALRARAGDRDATAQERGVAALGLWQRSIADRNTDLERTRQDLQMLIAEFRNVEFRHVSAAELRWIAATMEYVVNSEVAVCNAWPEVGEPWFQRVQEVTRELDNSGIPTHLLQGTKNLFRHMILQNAATYRRLAVETAVTSGWNEPVARALEHYLSVERDETWLRIRAQSALGSLQRHDMLAESSLTLSCEYAYDRLRLEETSGDSLPSSSSVSEMHAALFAVGDCFGVTGAEERARDARERLRPILTELATAEGDRAQILRRPARAAAYLLTVTAQPSSAARKDLSQDLLEQLSHHPDLATARLSRWALSFRFAPDGTIRPFLAAAQQGDENYDT